jgi:hypothetical protein
MTIQRPRTPLFFSNKISTDLSLQMQEHKFHVPVISVTASNCSVGPQEAASAATLMEYCAYDNSPCSTMGGAVTSTSPAE